MEERDLKDYSPILTSPTEPAKFLEMVDGVHSWEPEQYGCDFLIHGPEGRLGIQRKRFPDDFAASVRDGRLANQVMLMQELEAAIFILEGTPCWTAEGELVDTISTSSWGRQQSSHSWLTFSAVDSILMGLAVSGFAHFWTKDLTETAARLEAIRSWWLSDHSSLSLKPASVEGTRKRREARTAAALQVVPGIGVKTARAIARDHSLQLTATREELSSIKGVGNVALKKLEAQFGPLD